MIRCINWNYKPADVSWILKSEVKDVLHCWEDAAMEKLKETQADHVVYAYKKYYNDKDGNETFELNFMMTPLSDEEFYTRTSPFGTDYLVYALHKGTSFRK